jgi:heme a synthase
VAGGRGVVTSVLMWAGSQAYAAPTSLRDRAGSPPERGYAPPMSPPVETPELRRLRRFALAAIVTNVGIVITGGTVRITGSGLGCPTWPSCDGDSFVPRPGGEHNSWQMAIEFGNRLLTFVVLAAVVGLIWQLYRTRPHPPVLMRTAWILPIGVVGQALLGGIVVLTGLSPFTVAAHFLLSMVLIFTAVVVHEMVRTGATRAVPPAAIRHLTTAVAAAAFVVLVLGTVTTAAGPHGGDPSAARLDLDIRLAALAHADAVWLLLGLTLALVVLTWRGPARVRAAARALLGFEILQGVIGYTQYALGVPEALVVLHVVGATLVWASASAAWIRARPQLGRQTRGAVPISEQAPDTAPEGASPR